ncbi:MAG: efflux RND transporter periplasmic adaptor subunit [Wenzhouxiangella sp.]
MDIQRKQDVRPVWLRRWPIVLAGIALLLLVVLALALLNRPPAVSSERLWFGEVVEGELLREVSAAGTLVAPRVRAVTNRNAGVVEEVLVLPGDAVEAESILLVMSSPDLEEDLAQARWDLAAAEADEAVQAVEQENRELDLVAQLAQAESEYTSALIELQAQEELEQAQVFSAIEVERSRLRVQQLQRRLEAEQARMSRAPEHRSARQTASQARLARQRDKVSHLESLVVLLEVPADSPGIIQEINVQEGERLTAGELVARIVDPEHLIARLRVPEREAASMLPGLPVRLELGREVIEGEVARIDPTARDRHIDVDVTLVSSPLPPLRPDQSISGRIELERLEQVTYIPRPAQARQEGQRLMLFVVSANGRRARQVEVEIGRLSSREAEVLSGLAPGDRVILADMSDYQGVETVRLR